MIVHLLDGTYELFRQFYGRRRIPKREGEAGRFGAVAGVLHSVQEMIEGGATHLGVATDHGVESFRNRLWPGYKTSAGVERSCSRRSDIIPRVGAGRRVLSGRRFRAVAPERAKQNTPSVTLNRSSSLLVLLGLGALLAGEPSVAAALPAVEVIHVRQLAGFEALQGGEVVELEHLGVLLARCGVPEPGQLARPSQVPVLPAGRYSVWLEGEGLISAEQQAMLSSAGRFDREEPAQPFAMVPVGRVQLDPRVDLSPTQAVQIARIAAKPSPAVSHGFARWITAEARGEPVSVPSGLGVVLLYDTEARRYRAVSRPLSISATETALVSFPSAERQNATVVAILDDPVGQPGPSEAEVSLELEANGLTRSPDVLTTLEGSLLGIWYAAEGRYARIRADGAGTYLPATEVPLLGSGLKVLRATLRRKPVLDVRVELPAELSVEKAQISIVHFAGRAPVAEAERAPGELLEPVRFEDLPAEELLVTLRLLGGVNWVTRRRVDLRDSEWSELVFRPSLFHLAGRLYHGSEPSEGQIRLFTDQQERESVLTAVADEDGRYEIPLLMPGRFSVHVRVPGMKGPDYLVWTPYVDSDTELDIRVPLATAVIEVRDQESGALLEGAEVIYDSTRIVEGRRAGGTSGASLTDESGSAELPPLVRGSLRVQARKDGYLSSDPREVVVEEEGSQEIVIELEPVGEGSELTLLLSMGQPAGGAEVRAHRSAWNEPPLWEGRADERGVVRVPTNAAGSWLLVRHPQAGSWVQGWTGGPGTTWTLPPRGGRLLLRTVAPDGATEPWKSLAIRFPQAWVAGAALAWLAGTTIGGSGGDGHWSSMSMPAVELGVVAGSAERVRLALQGLLDGSTQAIPSQWPPSSIEVVAAQ